MNIHFSSIYHSTISSFKERWLSASHQNKIITVALFALSCVTAVYLIKRCCLERKVIPLNKQENTEAPKTVVKEIEKPPQDDTTKKVPKEDRNPQGSAPKPVEEKQKPVKEEKDEDGFTILNDTTIGEFTGKGVWVRVWDNKTYTQKGTFLNGDLQTGKITQPDGSFDEGQFKDDQLVDGYRKIVNLHGFGYNQEGEVREGTFDGSCKFIFPKKIIEGTYSDKWFTPTKITDLTEHNGKIFEGTFKGTTIDSYLLVTGTITYPDKSVDAGEFDENGNLVKGTITTLQGSVTTCGKGQKSSDKIEGAEPNEEEQEELLSEGENDEVEKLGESEEYQMVDDNEPAKEVEDNETPEEF